MNLSAGHRLPWGIALLLAGILAGVLLNRSLDPATPARAQSAGPSRVYTLSSDGFFVTANENGDTVHLWYFDRSGDRFESRLRFVTGATNIRPAR
jgi:hypothetical protein